MQPETTVTTSFFGFRHYEPADKRAPGYDLQEERDLNFLNNLCSEIHDLPTMQAAIKRTPDLRRMPIIGSYLLDSYFGKYSTRGMEMNLDRTMSGEPSEHFDVQLTTLPHEMRHGQQDVLGCLAVSEHPRIKPNLEDHIFISRYVEADATAFSLTVMYELFLLRGNEAPLRRAAEIHGGSVYAYRHEIGRDINSHWNGKAADAAFNAYFWDDNSAHLKNYDLELCEEFARKAQDEQGAHHSALTMPKGKKMRLLADHFRPMSHMPFVARNGRMAQREAYRPEICGDIMNHLSPEAREMIQESKSKLRLTPG